MARLKAFQGVVQQNADIADSVVVYIEEAHPSDGWMSTDAPYQIPKHRCLEDRLNAAQLMHLEVPGCVVVVDSMENSSNAAYGAYFDRLYILQEGKIVYQGGRGPEGYRISELRDWLDQYRARLEKSKNLVLPLLPNKLAVLGISQPCLTAAKKHNACGAQDDQAGEQGQYAKTDELTLGDEDTGGVDSLLQGDL
ncbi:hypothetical protein INR49_019902 [Caranx melampygus]|nr:hypothetical protein INR49_019902 [Caranx melampygus]